METLCEGGNTCTHTRLQFSFIRAIKMEPVFGWREEVSVLYWKNDTEFISAIFSLQAEFKCDFSGLKAMIV